MSSNNHLSSRRRETDVMKLLKRSQNMYLSKNISEFWVEFVGPEGTPYEEGTWVLHVVLPSEYPFKSPSIGFANRIWHPNIDETSGSVCLDVINQTWTPMYELKNIFDVFLPQLLRYPNPEDPLNPSAAALLQRDPTGYVTLLQEHVATYATRAKALASIPPPYGPLTGDTPISNAMPMSMPASMSPSAPPLPPHEATPAAVSSSSSSPEGEGEGRGGGCCMEGAFYQREEEEYVPEEIEL